jgi:hypothetical protein
MPNFLQSDFYLSLVEYLSEDEVHLNIIVCNHYGYLQLCNGRFVLDRSRLNFGKLCMLIKKRLNSEYCYSDEELRKTIIPTTFS